MHLILTEITQSCRSAPARGLHSPRSLLLPRRDRSRARPPQGPGSFEVTRCIFKAPRRAGLGQKSPAARSPASSAQPGQLLLLPGAPTSTVLGFGKASVPPEGLPWVRDSFLTPASTPSKLVSGTRGLCASGGLFLLFAGGGAHVEPRATTRLLHQQTLPSTPC